MWEAKVGDPGRQLVCKGKAAQEEAMDRRGRRAESGRLVEGRRATDILQESHQPPTTHKAVGDKNLTIVLIFESGPYFVPQAGVKPTVPFRRLPNAGTAMYVLQWATE